MKTPQDMIDSYYGPGSGFIPVQSREFTEGQVVRCRKGNTHSVLVEDPVVRVGVVEMCFTSAEDAKMCFEIEVGHWRPV